MATTTPSGWEPVIGLEVHAQLLTATKAFCRCRTSFGDPPNTHVCPVCLGLPGSLPVLNERAVEYALRFAEAVNLRVPEQSTFSRKNYFYPDMPKDYQVSQYDEPITVDGWLEVDGGRVGIERAHLEEDTGKTVHVGGGGRIHEADHSLVDYNRAGVPLMEIVSRPDLRNAEHARSYVGELRAVLQAIGVSDVKMEEGSMRVDANVSVRPSGASELGTKVEIKNMNSFRAVERAIAYELERHVRVLEEGGTLVQETRLWDPDREETRSMRSKESAHDYRYFPDPDLPPLVLTDAFVEEVRRTLPELPDARRQRFVTALGLPEYDAEVLTARRDVADYFEAVVRAHDNAKAASNWVMGDILRLVRERKLDDAPVITEWPVAAAHLAELIALIDEGAISGKIAKTVFEEMVAGGAAPRAIVAERGLTQVSDEGTIVTAIDQVLAANASKVDEYRSGKDKLFGFFVGQVMKATSGKANPEIVNRVLKERLGGSTS